MMNSSVDRRVLVMCAMAFIGGVISAGAEEPAGGEKPDPVMKVAVARAEAEIVIRAIGGVANANENGWQNNRNLGLAGMEKARNVYVKGWQEEERVDQSARDQPFIQQCREEYDRLGANSGKWEMERFQFNQKQHNELCAAVSYMAQSFSYINTLETWWKYPAAGLDLDQITGLYKALATRIPVVKKEIEGLVGEMKARADEMQNEVEKAEKFVNAHFGR